MSARWPAPPPPPDDEFYIGYDPPMPPRIAARVTQVAAAVIVASAVAAMTALAAHRRLAPAAFDFGRPQPLHGVLQRTPYPELKVDGRRSLLVGFGKQGAESDLAGIPDGPVTLAGTRIERDGHRMFEVVPGSVRALTASKSGTKSVPVGPGPTAMNWGRPGSTTIGARPRQAHVADPADVTLQGEIVDSKCFLGVMNPGEGTVHRDCARVCLRGGIPPMLLVRGARAEEALVLLVDDAGAPIGRQLADLAGVPVEVNGRLTRDGDRLVLFTARTRVVPLTR
ncbi:MAG: hypothetical protein AB7H93_07790 [Vicinamibacterales bacterium]